MRVLVTGAAGFLGTNLVAALRADGHEVVGFDRRGGKGIIHGDVRNMKRDLVPPFDIIYHLACDASPPVYQARPLNTFWTAVRGTSEVLDIALEVGARVVVASTSECYGDPLVSPQSEDYLGNVATCGPRAVYDEGKRAAETLCYEYAQLGLDVRIARIFNTYGPHMEVRDGRMIPNFITQALRGVPLTVYGDGSQTRSICYVDDLIDGLRTLADAPRASVETHGWRGLVFNIGNPIEMSVLAVAAAIISRTGTRSPMAFHELPGDDPKQRVPDISRIRKLGWSPVVGAGRGLAQTIEYFRSMVLP